MPDPNEPSSPGALPAPLLRSDAPASADGVRRRGVAVALGRLVVATLLLGGTIVLSGGDLSAPSTRLALGLVVIAYAGSIVFALAADRSSRPSVVAGAQVALDLLLTSGLVYLTDGAHSGFASLYAVVVLTTAIAMGPRAAMVTTGVALLLYLALGLSAASEWIPLPPDRVVVSYVHSPSELALAVLRTSVGLLVVAALSVGLSERLSLARGEAAQAARRAAGYERLTDDIVRSISAGLLTTDDSGVVDSANALAGTILGRSEADIVGQPITAFLPLAATAPRAAQRGEARVARPDGKSVPVGYTRTPLVSAEGRARGALVLFQDLSEITDLREKAARAERLAALGKLTVGLAHEIRNPLGSISGSVELVRDAAQLGAEDRRLLDLVLSETHRLNELVGTMLQIGRPSTPERVEVDLAAACRDVVETLERDEALVRARGIVLRCDADGPALASADPGQLRQVIWNLLKNAVQVSPAGAEVVIRTRGTEGGASLEVADTGPGIPATDRAQLFDMFFSKRAGGVGLGLTLVRQIVEAHGGEIDVESEAPGGTTFRVTLPAGRTPSPAATAPAGPENANVSEPRAVG